MEKRGEVRGRVKRGDSWTTKRGNKENRREETSRREVRGGNGKRKDKENRREEDRKQEREGLEK